MKPIIRRIVHSLTPPIFLRLILSYRQQKRFIGEYRSYEEAVKLGSYNSDDIVDRVSQKTSILKKSKDKLIRDRLTLQNLFVMQNILINLNNRTKLDIVEIGGGCGKYYIQASKFFPHIIDRWIVVETPKMAKEGNKEFSDAHLQFVDDLDKALIKVQYRDLCIAQGVIQCLSKPIDYLGKILNSGFKYIYISRLSLGVNISKPIICVQVSSLLEHGHGSSTNKTADKALVHYPTTILPEKKFLKMLSASEYKIRYQFDENEYPNLNFGNKQVLIKTIGFLLKHG